MNRLEVARLLILVAFLQGSLSGFYPLAAQDFSKKDYPASDVNFANPERGFYHHTEAHSTSYVPLSANELLNYRNEGITLVMRVFYLENFVDGDISRQYLDNMRNDFLTARNAGVKIILRFAYTTDSSPPFGDATPERVLAHIAQLAPVIRENADVVAVAQAGFIGAWGEWYYTDHFSQFVGSNNESNWADRRAVVNAFLDALPLSRAVQIRTPVYKKKMVESPDALTADEAFTGSMKSRLGHHNDCFISSSSDVGTYIDVVNEKNYIEQETYFVPIGGETCALSGARSECPNALAELSRLHWSFLNEDYFPQVISGFETGGCLMEIRQKLGYRYRLTKGTLQVTGKPGGTFNINLALVNDGWANAYNPRWVEIVLRNDDTGKEYFFKTNEDPRKWSLSDTIKIDQVIGLPPSMESATYSIHLNLPDPETSLYDKPSFSIRLANTDVWQDQSGYNSLGKSIQVDASIVTPAYAGDNFFIPRYEVDPALQPTPLFTSASSKEVLLYWGILPDDPYRVIQRKDESSGFKTIATLSGTQTFFKDTDVVPEGSYTYRYFFAKDNLISMPVPPTTQTTKQTDPVYYEFLVDGNSQEWEIISPLATAFAGGETYAIRAFADGDSLNILLEGSAYTSYDIYIDADNRVATGKNEPTWTTNGFDYKIRDGSLYKAQDNSWVLVNALYTKQQGRFREVSVSLSALENLSQNIILNLAATITLNGGNKVNLPFADQAAAVFVRSLAAPVPAAFAVINSETIPETRIVIQWTSCTTCKGYVIERSLSATNGFAPIFNGTTGNLYRDDGLTVNTTYYYRMFFFNETGRSGYTEVRSATTHIITGVEEEHGVKSLFPNPVDKLLHIRFVKPLDESREIVLYDAVGKSVQSQVTEQPGQDVYETILDLSTLPTGFYIIWISERGQRNAYRILKL